MDGNGFWMARLRRAVDNVCDIKKLKSRFDPGLAGLESFYSLEYYCIMGFVHFKIPLPV